MKLASDTPSPDGFCFYQALNFVDAPVISLTKIGPSNAHYNKYEPKIFIK